MGPFHTEHVLQAECLLSSSTVSHEDCEFVRQQKQFLSFSVELHFFACSNSRSSKLVAPYKKYFKFTCILLIVETFFNVDPPYFYSVDLSSCLNNLNSCCCSTAASSVNKKLQHAIQMLEFYSFWDASNTQMLCISLLCELGVRRLLRRSWKWRDNDNELEAALCPRNLTGNNDLLSEDSFWDSYSN